jgi:DNA-binding response OmpR family regulator
MKKILLVDDLELDCFLARLALDCCHPEFKIIVASSCEEAYRAIKEQHFDLILLDITMPLMGGLELLERFYAEGTKAPPTIIVSASSQRVDRMLALALGAVDYIHKAVDYAVFKEELRAAVGRAGIGQLAFHL